MLLVHITNDHCSVDTPLLVKYVESTTARRRRHQFVPLFFESNSTFLGLLVQVSLVPKEVVRWVTDERIAMGCRDKARLLIRLSPVAAQEA